MGYSSRKNPNRGLGKGVGGEDVEDKDTSFSEKSLKFSLIISKGKSVRVTNLKISLN